MPLDVCIHLFFGPGTGPSCRRGTGRPRARGKRRGFSPGASARHSQSARVSTDFASTDTHFFHLKKKPRAHILQKTWQEPENGGTLEEMVTQNTKCSGAKKMVVENHVKMQISAKSRKMAGGKSECSTLTRKDGQAKKGIKRNCANTSTLNRFLPREPGREGAQFQGTRWRRAPKDPKLTPKEGYGGSRTPPKGDSGGLRGFGGSPNWNPNRA